MCLFCRSLKSSQLQMRQLVSQPKAKQLNARSPAILYPCDTIHDPSLKVNSSFKAANSGSV